MSCCGDKCGCGSGCKCGSNCGGCKMYPDMSYFGESSNTETVILGVAPVTKAEYSEASGESGAENGGCKCGSDCQCNPCTCK